ncbi:MAG: hypothetical protein V1782_08265, partial [Pseudomonadota bacterium]
RFNLYNTCRTLATCCPETSLSTQQLRDTLQRFAGQGLRFTGSHAQKVILDKRLILFWNSFLIPSYETFSYDLSTFRAALRAWRFVDLTANPIMKQLLVPSYRSFTKEYLAKHCLHALFSSPKKYNQFVNWQTSHLSPAGGELYATLLQSPQPARKVIYNNEGWLAACELWDALLLHPAYNITPDGEIFLQLEPFKGFKTPFRLEPSTTRPIITPDPCLEPIRLITNQLLQGQSVPLPACNCKRTFPERQLDLFREAAGSLIGEIRRFLEWWDETIGPGTIPREALPPPGCLLTCSTSGKYIPFIMERRDLEPILETSLKFGLLTREDSNNMTLSRLGRMFIYGTLHEFEVKTIWARNINRLSIHLGKGWSEGFHRLLDLLATSQGSGEYVVTPASLAQNGLKPALAMVIVSGFTRLDTRRTERLSSWTNDNEGKKSPARYLSTN